MNRQPLVSLLSSLKQRPWPLIPLFGAAPVVSLLLVSQARQAPENLTPAPVVETPIAAIASPNLATNPIANSAAIVGPPAPQASTTPTATKAASPAKTSATSKPTTKATAKPSATAPAKEQASAAKSSTSPKSQTSAKSPASTSKKAIQADPTSSSAAQRLAALQNSSSAAIDGVLEIKVAITHGVNSLSVGTSNGGAIVDTNGQVLHQLPTETGYAAQLDGSGITINGWQLPSTVFIEPNAGGFVYIGDRWYRGRLMLVVRESGLLAINYVLLRDYLYSVVGAEVSPSWPMAALKAQAIAARSYALTYYFKPAHSLYNIGDDESYQVYAGADKEADTTYQAVDQTAGEFISYRGGIVESLYAASDDIVIEAHGGRGMSQLGALKLAEEGYDYRQILGTYYPGTGLARIEVDHR